MTRVPLATATLLGLLLTGCGGGGGEEAAPTEQPTEQPSSSETATSAVPVSFEGDPGSPFCERSREAADEPVLDPFEAGLEPRDVELRFRALAQRFSGFADIAPDPLAEDLALLDQTFQDLAALLEDADYDFTRLADADVEVSVFDDPELAVVADRLQAYQEQVCGL